MTHCLLAVNALAACNMAAMVHENETNKNFILCKPARVNTQEFIACVNEMNKFLREFPMLNGEPTTALPKDKILIVLEFRVPNS